VVQAVQLESAAALLKSGDGRVGVMMNSSKGKAKESVRIKPENLQLFSRKIATDRVVLPGLRCIIRHHSKAHDRLVVEVVAYDPRTDSVAVRAVTLDCGHRACSSVFLFTSSEYALQMALCSRRYVGGMTLLFSCKLAAEVRVHFVRGSCRRC
jgi:hypothetical protein